MKYALAAALSLLALAAHAQTTLTVPAQSCTAVVTCQPSQVTIPGGSTSSGGSTGTTQPSPTPVAGAPTITAVKALPMGWLVYFLPPSSGGPWVNFFAGDPNQKWLNSGAGSTHRQSRSPIYVQGGSGSASFVVYAQSASGWSKPSATAAAVSSPGKAPTLASAIYDGTTYNWSGDFSFPGGDANCKPTDFGGTGNAPNPNTVDIAWFDTTVPGIAGGASIRVDSPVAGNFAPAIPSMTLPAPTSGYLSLAIQPDYAGAEFQLIFEGNQDADVSQWMTLSKYVSGGKFVQGQWNRINIPVSAMGFSAPIYKVKIQQAAGTGVYHVSDIRFSSGPL